MDINDLPLVMYACFVLHNFCEMNKDVIHEESVRSSIVYERQFQPTTTSNRYATEKNEAEGKRVLAKYFDP